MRLKAYCLHRKTDFLVFCALNSRDLPLMMGLFSFTGFLTLTSILIADVLYVLADPRITFRSRI